MDIAGKFIPQGAGNVQKADEKKAKPRPGDRITVCRVLRFFSCSQMPRYLAAAPPSVQRIPSTCFAVAASVY